jgi:glycosyltransferase involved in cell wall biosynthesis
MTFPKTPQRRLRILLVTPAIHPKMIGRPYADWHLAKQLEKHADVHIATEERYRGDAILGGFRPEQITSICCKNVQKLTLQIARRLRGVSGRTSAAYSGVYHAAHPWFEHKVIQALRPELESEQFDIVHRLGPLTSLVGSPLAGFCARKSIQFVWGPIIDELVWPHGFQQYREWRDWPLWEQLINHLTRAPKTLACASQLIAGSANTEKLLSKWASKTTYIPADAFDEETLVRKELSPVIDVPRLIYQGRLCDFKGSNLLLEAAAMLLREKKLTLDIIGEGPEKAQMEKFVNKEHLHSQVRFLGWVPESRLHSVIHEGHIFGFPALRQVRGVRLLEAMALGLTPIGLEYGACEEYLSVDRGVAVKANSRADFVRAMRRTLYELAENPAQLQRLRQNAQDFAYGKCTWRKRAEQYLEVYQKAVKDQN